VRARADFFSAMTVGMPRGGAGPTSMAILAWSLERLARHRTLQPQQNSFVESFNGRLRDD
jgi:hypothetical protein